MPPAYLLVWAWPAAIGAVSAVYGGKQLDLPPLFLIAAY
jgi:hypothetical protein